MLSTPVDCCPHDHIGRNWSQGSCSTLLCQIWLSTTNQASEMLCDGKSMHFHTRERGSLPSLSLPFPEEKTSIWISEAEPLQQTRVKSYKSSIKLLFLLLPFSEVTTVRYRLTVTKPAAIHFLWHYTQAISCNKQLRTVTYTLNICLSR